MTAEGRGEASLFLSFGRAVCLKAIFAASSPSLSNMYAEISGKGLCEALITIKPNENDGREYEREWIESADRKGGDKRERQTDSKSKPSLAKIQGMLSLRIDTRWGQALCHLKVTVESTLYPPLTENCCQF